VILLDYMSNVEPNPNAQALHSGLPCRCTGTNATNMCRVNITSSDFSSLNCIKYS
jgi:hypothetical protein